MYKVIRVSGDYEFVVLCEEQNGEKTYCRYAQWRGSERDIGTTPMDAGKTGAAFEPITERAAGTYFSGQSDGMGFGELPENSFHTLQDVWTWLREKRFELHKKLIRDGGPTT